MRPYRFRIARADDQPALFALYQRIILPHIEAIWGWDPQWQATDFTRHFDPDHITLALQHAAPVAYVQAEPQTEALFVRMLVVAPEHQNRGLGSQLLARTLREANRRQLGLTLQVFNRN